MINTGPSAGEIFGMVLMGCANAAVQLGRFAAAEVWNSNRKLGQAVARKVKGLIG